MPEGKKLTLTITDEVHANLESISEELGIPTTDLLRRAIGLVSITHGLLQEVDGEDMYICSKDVEGNFSQQHVISPLMY